MGFEDWFRLSAHAVITDPKGRVLQLKATYGEKAWCLPGGALDPAETVHEALSRECAEELGCEIRIVYLSGVYSHTKIQSHAFIFRCELNKGSEIKLSAEHSEYRYFSTDELGAVQQRRVLECIGYQGQVRSARF